METTQIQCWAISTANQDVISIGETVYNMSIQALCASDPEFQVEICNEATGEGFLYNTSLTSEEIEADLSADGKRTGAIVSGTHPPCAS